MGRMAQESGTSAPAQGPRAGNIVLSSCPQSTPLEVVCLHAMIHRLAHGTESDPWVFTYLTVARCNFRVG